MRSPKKILDKIKESIVYYVFEHGTFDLHKMMKVNEAYSNTWKEITVAIVILVCIVTINIILMLFLRVILNLHWVASLIICFITSYLTRKVLYLFLKAARYKKKQTTTGQ